MNNADILEHASTVEERSIGELQKWLQYAKHTWPIGAGIFFFPYGLVLMALKVVAYVFSPFMLYYLFRAGWYKSVAVLLTMVVLPFALAHFIQLEHPALNYLFTFLPFFNFYLYIYSINYLIGEYMIKVETLKQWGKK